MFFAKFNKTRFDYDAVTTDWGKDRYKKVHEIFDPKNPNKIFTVRGMFTIKKDEKHPDMINDESPVVTIDDAWVNVPQHQLEEVKDILSDPAAIEYINQGKCGFILRPYETPKRKETCYSLKWVDIPSGDEV